MEWKDVLAQLVTFVQETSPEIWRILLKQTRVMALQNLFGFFVSVTIVILLRKAAKKATEKAEEINDWEIELSMAFLFSWIGIVIACCIACCFLSDTIALFVNPEFYAIELLIQSFSVN